MREEQTRLRVSPPEMDGKVVLRLVDSEGHYLWSFALSPRDVWRAYESEIAAGAMLEIEVDAGGSDG